MTCVFNTLKRYQRSYDSVCDFLKGLNLLSLETGIGVLQDHVYQKYFWILEILKDGMSLKCLICSLRILDVIKMFSMFFKDIKGWDVIKMFMFLKNIKEWDVNKMFNMFLSKDGMSLKCLIKIFQKEIASGKKLFMYLFDLHIISRKVVRKLCSWEVIYRRESYY